VAAPLSVAIENDNSANVLGPEVVRMVNEFTTKKCTELKAEASAISLAATTLASPAQTPSGPVEGAVQGTVKGTAAYEGLEN
jgi:hypothetical protein